MVDYAKYLKNAKKFTDTCGKRAVFLKKVDGDKVQALIKPKIVKTYLRKSVIFDCCYRFISRFPRNQYGYSKKIKYVWKLIGIYRGSYFVGVVVMFNASHAAHINLLAPYEQAG